jgi:NTE family protein
MAFALSCSGSDQLLAQYRVRRQTISAMSAKDTADRTESHLRTLLRRHAPPALATERTVVRIASVASWFTLPGGTLLFEKGDRSDAIYLLLSGLLGVLVPDTDGGERVVARLGPGELVGEMGCVSGQPRAATIRALRTCELLRVPWRHLEDFARVDPAMLTLICRTVVARLVGELDGKPRDFRPRSFALVPLGDALGGRKFVDVIAQAFSAVGSTHCVDRAAGKHMQTDEFFRLESTFDYVLYLADPGDEAWSRRCLRQSDVNLIIVDGADRPRGPPSFMSEMEQNIPSHLALTWRKAVVPGRAAAWIAALGVERHHHVRKPADIGRMARLLTGTGTGLVLSGGGARGLAHIGVARTLRDHGVSIDAIIGTSIGGLIGAGLALELDPETLIERVRRFARVSPLFDLTLPRQSLLAGRRLRSLLFDWFGDLRIEDTPIPFSCISANLTTGSLSAHRSGSLRQWTAAATAIPGVFPPVYVNGVAHVDGAVLNNLPTDLARESGAGFVVAVDVARGALRSDDLEPITAERQDIDRMTILEILTRVGSLGDRAEAARRRSQCDVLITPEVSAIGLVNFRAYRHAVDAGARATVAHLGALRLGCATRSAGNDSLKPSPP